LYWDNEGLKIGASYQTERAFIWVRLLTDASRAGQSTMRLSSFNLLLGVTTSTTPDPSINDSVVTVAYESESDDRVLTVVSF